MNIDTSEGLLDKVPIPRLMSVEQHFEQPVVKDVEATFRREVKRSGLLAGVCPGWKVAIAVGSRGIANQATLIRILAGELRAVKAEPFVIPAMGSHRGATAAGQTRVLEHLGLSEDSLRAPIRATMEVERIGETVDGVPVFIDRYAMMADAVVIINRIKPHVSFSGRYESGLTKMIAIGLGKQKGAEVCHDLGFGRMEHNMLAIAGSVLKCLNLIGAIALIENAYHETARIEILEKEEIAIREPMLLEESKALTASIPFADLDVLVIDEIGKNISGTGLDTNVVGRFHTSFAGTKRRIKLTRIVLLNLTPESEGNANGVGIADFITKRLFEKINFSTTYANSLTSTVPVSVKIPMILPNDRQAIQAAIKTCNITD